MVFSLGTKPQKRESALSCRLSPIMKYMPGGTTSSPSTTWLGKSITHDSGIRLPGSGSGGTEGNSSRNC